MLEALKDVVCRANRDLERSGLITLTWGNASGIDRASGLVAIKPSGVGYASLVPADIVLVDMEGKVAEGRLRPSSDTPAHLALYRAFASIGGAAHTHSRCATAFAQAARPIPCLGTTHADHFHGEVPVTRQLTRQETEGRYEMNAGMVIVERMAGIDPLHMPAVLVAGHGPFTWGRDAADAVHNAVALEAVARMALDTFALNPGAAPIPDYLLAKHFLRKHGPGAYYGQRK